MLRWYGYVGVFLIVLVELNFYFVIQPFALWYLPVVWIGYMLLVDSLVYKIKGKSLISTYTTEFILMCIISAPLWLVFEAYNLFTHAWYYINVGAGTWYFYVIGFATIMPALLETFTLISAIGPFKHLDRPIVKVSCQKKRSAILVPLVVVGLCTSAFPFVDPAVGYLLMWSGILLLLDPLNYLMGRPSVIHKLGGGKKGTMYELLLSGLVTGFFWEFWNYQAYPRWVYNLPNLMPSVHLFAMPIVGYIGYLPFAADVYLVYALCRSLVFKNGNQLLNM